MGSTFSKKSKPKLYAEGFERLDESPSGNQRVMAIENWRDRSIEERTMWTVRHLGVEWKSYKSSLEMEIEGAKWSVLMSAHSASSGEMMLTCSSKLGSRWDSRYFSVKASIQHQQVEERYQSAVKRLGKRNKIFCVEKRKLMPFLSDVGSLELELIVTIFPEKPAFEIRKNLTSETGVSPLIDENPRSHYGRFLMSDESSDVKIYSSDGQEFHAHKFILCAENEVFDTMFKAGMTEATTGIVKLDDMSAAAVRFLLSFIYDGNILPFSVTGKTVEGVFRDTQNRLHTSEDTLVTAEEVLYVAAKYKLGGVLEHLGRSVRGVCSEENVASLFELSKLYSLDCKALQGVPQECHQVQSTRIGRNSGTMKPKCL